MSTGSLIEPPPYIIGDKKEWITSDEPETAGFAILVRTSITHAEKEALKERANYIQGEYSEQWFAKPPEERDIDADSPRVMQRKLLAPYVYGWNAWARTSDGELARVPPPAEAGHEAFDTILPEQLAWIVDVVLDGYYVLGKVGSWRTLSARIGSTSDAKPPAADPLPPPESTRKRRSRRQS